MVLHGLCVNDHQVAVQCMIWVLVRWQDVDNKTGSDNGNANSENIYVTIDEVLSVDGSNQEEPPTSKLTRTQNRVLQVME